MTGGKVDDAATHDLFEALERAGVRLSEEQKVLGEAGSSAGGISAILDVSDPVREVYLELLKHGDMTMDEIRERVETEDPDALPVYVKILVRQGHLQQHKDGEVLRYSARTGERGRKKLSDDIWDLLD